MYPQLRTSLSVSAVCVRVCAAVCFQGIPSSPVQETNPPAQLPASARTETPTVAEGETICLYLCYSITSTVQCILEMFSDHLTFYMFCYVTALF